MATDTQSPTDNIKGAAEQNLQTFRAKLEPQLQNARDHLPDSSQVQTILARLAIGIAVLTVGGATFTGAAVFLPIATPIFIILSPILILLGGVLFVVTALLATVVATLVALLSAGFWLYKYFKGEEPPYYEQVDAARTRIAITANDVKMWAQNHVPQVQAAPSA